MPQIFANNSISTLSASLADIDTTVFIQPAHGARFPVVSGGDFAFCALEDAAGNVEVVKVTAHAASASSFTVVRAQQGTTALAWASGDLFELRPTAEEAARWEAAAVELVASRQGQASLLANLLRFVNTFAPAAGNVDAGGFRVRNAADGALSLDYVTLQQLQAASFAGVLPGQAGNFGKMPRTDGTNIHFDDAWGPAVPITSNTTLQVRRVYHLDSTGGAFTVTLPTMAVDDWIWLCDESGACSVNNITVDRAGQNIRHVAEDLLMDMAYDSFMLVGTASGVIER